MENIKIIIKEDNSVLRAMNNTAKRNGGGHKNVSKSILRRFFDAFIDVVCFALALFCCALCFCVMNAKLQNVPPTFAGVSVVRIKTPSMVASGFDVGECVAVKRVDTKTLKEGDIIAFYVFEEDYSKFNIDICVRVNNSEAETRYLTSFSSFVGLQSGEVIKAAKSNSVIVFHQISKIFEDDYGVWWFKTKGTSNPAVDPWVISENMVVGAYFDEPKATVVSSFVGKVAGSSLLFFLFVMIPISIILFFMFKEKLFELKTYWLEGQVVKGKIALNAPCCLLCNVGANLTQKEKFKVLASARQSQKLEFVNLLWKSDKPIEVQKYYLRKSIKLMRIDRQEGRNGERAQVYEYGENERNLAKYFKAEQRNIFARQDKLNKKLEKAVIKANLPRRPIE